MELQTVTYLIVGLSFALYLGIAFWARAGSTSEFYVAGGGVNPVMNGMATAADWMSAASFISMAGLISNMGYGGAVFLMGWTGDCLAHNLFISPNFHISSSAHGCFTNYFGKLSHGINFNTVKFNNDITILKASFLRWTIFINISN